MTATATPTPRLRALVARGARPRAADEACELCAAPLPEDHRHLLDLSERTLRCVCRACTILFDRDAAGGGHFRLIPERRVRLDPLGLDAEGWRALGVPVGLAGLLPLGDGDQALAIYPSPAGPTESEVDADRWRAAVAAAPALAQAQPDVEAVLVNHLGDTWEHYLVPIDDCYRLVALFRDHWQGFSGGDRIWAEVDSFFERLRATAQPLPDTKDS